VLLLLHLKYDHEVLLLYHQLAPRITLHRTTHQNETFPVKQQATTNLVSSCSRVYLTAHASFLQRCDCSHTPPPLASCFHAAPSRCRLAVLSPHGESVSKAVVVLGVHHLPTQLQGSAWRDSGLQSASQQQT
jgi:hypothetical protein